MHAPVVYSTDQWPCPQASPFRPPEVYLEPDFVRHYNEDPEGRLDTVVALAPGDLAGGVRIGGVDGDPPEPAARWIDGEGQREIDFADIDLNLRFAPHSEWVGRIERDERGVAACAS